MTHGRWEDDECLLAEIAEAVREPGPVRAAYLEAGRRAYAWRAVDAELALALLAYDTALDDELPASLRRHDPARTLVFASTELSIEIQVTGGELAGQLGPPQPGRITVFTPAGPIREVAANERGRFLIERPRGPIRIRCRTGAAGVVTEWVSV
jgi:hypothetical protein